MNIIKDGFTYRSIKNVTKCWGTVEWRGIYLAWVRLGVLDCAAQHHKTRQKQLKSKQNLRHGKLCDIKTQQLRMFTTLAKTQSLVLSIHDGLPTATCNSGSKNCDSGLHKHLHPHLQMGGGGEMRMEGGRGEERGSEILRNNYKVQI